MKRRSLLKSLFVAPFLPMIKKEQQEEEYETIPVCYCDGTSAELKVNKGIWSKDEYFEQFHKVLDLHYQSDRCVLELVKSLERDCG